MVLSDFDLAWYEGAICKTTTRLGDQSFASPEQLKEDGAPGKARAESDLYSMGMLIYFIMSKVIPPAGQWYNANLQKEVFQVTLKEMTWITVAKALADLVNRCASKTPYDRPTAKEVQAELTTLEAAERGEIVEPEFFLSEVRHLLARTHLDDPFSDIQHVHLEQKRDFGKMMLHSAFIRQRRESDDRGSFKANTKRDVALVKEHLEKGRLGSNLI